MQTVPGRWLVALHSRDFRLLWTSELISAIGSEMLNVALYWQMYLLTHSALALGLLGMVSFLPIMLFSLPGGTVADAHNRKKILYVTQPIIVLCSLLLALATFTHIITPLLIYLFTALVAAAVAFDLPARSALIPNLVDRKDLTNTMSIYETLWQIASIIGPAIAGLLIASIGVGGIYTIDGISTITVPVALLLMKHSGEPEGEKNTISPISMKEGLAFVWSRTMMWSTILLDCFATLLASATVLLPIYARDILHVGSRGLGFLYAAPAFGAVIAGSLMAQRGQRIRYQGRALLVAVALYGLAIMLFGLSHW